MSFLKGILPSYQRNIFFFQRLKCWDEIHLELLKEFFVETEEVFPKSDSWGKIHHVLYSGILWLISAQSFNRNEIQLKVSTEMKFS